MSLYEIDNLEGYILLRSFCYYNSYAQNQLMHFETALKMNSTFTSLLPTEHAIGKDPPQSFIYEYSYYLEYYLLRKNRKRYPDNTICNLYAYVFYAFQSNSQLTGSHQSFIKLTASDSMGSEL